MLHIKNIPTWERILRIIIAIATIGYGIYTQHWIIIAAAVAFSVTGLIGFCPMCAVAGRKIKSK